MILDISLDEVLFLDTELLAEDIFDLDFLDEYFLDVELFSVSDEAFVDLETLSQNIELELEIGTVINGGGHYPLYPGPYVAIPKVREQNFDTDHKELIQDFKVKEITYLEVLNASGGLTVTIGEV